jgi:hypothetical protein
MDSYFTNHEMTKPFTSGLCMKDMSREQMLALSAEITEAEKKNPFAKYYYEPLAPLQPQMEAAIENGPLSPEEMYMPQQAGRIMLTGSKDYPTSGWGVLDNGVGYSSMVVHQDGLSDEKIVNYREHFAVTDDPEQRTLFYKTWFPGKHLIHFNDGIIEDFGWGFTLQTMDWDIFNMEKHLGVKMEEIPKLDPHCIALIGLGGPCVAIENPDDRSDTCMVQYTRETEKGRDLCIHYWNGVKLSPDGKIEVNPNVDPETMSERMKGMMLHAMTESCNELHHINEYWQETHPAKD